MRQIIVDTETTGLDPALGHRIIEIAAVELINRRPTGNHFHRYINPERDSEEAALQVHGLTSEFLSDKPKFRDIAREFVEFVRGAELVIHNSAFDIAFINHELSLISSDPINTCCPGIVDTLKLAREIHPGKRNALDSLCDRYQIDNSSRTLHGALLDAQLLAEVYLAMTRGQESLMIDDEVLQITVTATKAAAGSVPVVILAASAEELHAHEQHLSEIAQTARTCIWLQLREKSSASLEAA
jgi:DNA polymerase III subunit epsilon